LIHDWLDRENQILRRIPYAIAVETDQIVAVETVLIAIGTCELSSLRAR